MNWLNIIRGCVRPYISITGWTAFIAVAVWAIVKFANADLARELAVGFIASVSTIVGVWLGARGASK